MATKLKDLKVTSVDLVDVGANQEAHVMLYKNKDGKTQGDFDVGLSDRDKGVLKRFLSKLSKAFDSMEEAQADTPGEVEKAGETSGAEPEKSEATANSGVAKNDSTRGGEVMVNTEKMTPAERAFYEEIVKRYGVDATEQSATEGEVEKSNTKKDDEDKKATEEKCVPEKTAKAAEADDVAKSAESEDIYAGLHPAVKAELQQLRKRADEAEQKELLEVAKKYEVIGKKPEELAPILKNLKAEGGNAYSDMIGVLDAAVDAVEKSGLFTEIGKSGSTVSGSETAAWAKIEKKADDIQAQNPTLTRFAAIDLACQQNPTLVHEYESEK